MIYREHYIKKLREHYGSDTVKIITGIRGAGKSVILGQIMSEIKDRGDRVLHLDFEDRRVLSSIKNGTALVDHVRENRGKGLCYLFLDEPQVIDGWQEACKTLRDEGCSLFIAGSDRRVVSDGFIGALDGNFVSVTVYPFTYKEAREYAAELGREISVDGYMTWGGFPRRFELDTREEQEKYLDALDTRIIDDIIYRYKIRKESLFRGVADFVISSHGRIFSAKAIHGYAERELGACSVNTVMKYLEYLEEAYVISTLRQYSSREGRELNFYTKIYNTDVALSTLRRESKAENAAYDLENTVYRELIFMGYSVCAYVCRGGEVDFLASRGNKKYFVQTAYSVSDGAARENAFAAFREIDNLSQKILITRDTEDYSTSAVRHISFEDFLLMPSLDTWGYEGYERPAAEPVSRPTVPEIKREPRKKRTQPKPAQPKPVELNPVEAEPVQPVEPPKPKKKDMSVYLL